MTAYDFITAADLAEEQMAIDALRQATTTAELGIIWAREQP